MVEFFQNLNIQDLWVTFVGFISLNGATIVGLILAWARGKIKHGMEMEKIKAAARDEQKAVTEVCLETLGKVKDEITALELRINDAIKAAKDAEKAEIEANSIKLAQTLNEAKIKAVSLTEELNKL